jgi:hypothetical protein
LRVEALLDPEETQRQAAVQHCQRTCLPVVLGRLIDRLVELLGTAPEPVRGRAVASLAQFGARALPALTLTFMRTRRADLQHNVATTLRRMARGYARDQLTDLMLEVAILMRFAVCECVSQELARVIAVLRRASEAAYRKGRNRAAGRDRVPLPDAESPEAKSGVKAATGNDGDDEQQVPSLSLQ